MTTTTSRYALRPTCRPEWFPSSCARTLQVNATQFRVEVPLNNNLGLVNKTVRAKSYQILLGKLAIGGTVSVSTSLAAEAEFGPIEVRYVFSCVALHTPPRYANRCTRAVVQHTTHLGQCRQHGGRQGAVSQQRDDDASAGHDEVFH